MHQAYKTPTNSTSPNTFTKPTSFISKGEAPKPLSIQCSPLRMNKDVSISCRYIPCLMAYVMAWEISSTEGSSHPNQTNQWSSQTMHASLQDKSENKLRRKDFTVEHMQDSVTSLSPSYIMSKLKWQSCNGMAPYRLWIKLILVMDFNLNLNLY